MSTTHHLTSGGTWQQTSEDDTKLFTPWLPWNLTKDYPANAPPVSAHYFTAFPRRISASYDFYGRYWAQPGDSEDATDHAFYGGLVRDKPLVYRHQSFAGSWERGDMKLEVRQAMASRIDGWTIDMLGLTGEHWTKITRMCTAIDEVNAEDGTSFWLAPMPDGTAVSTASVQSFNVVDETASANALADAINVLNITYNCLYKPNAPASLGDRLMIPIFGPERWPGNLTNVDIDDRGSAFWQQVRDRLATHDTEVDFWMCYVGLWVDPECAPTMDSISIGHGRWGDRDAVTVNADTLNNRNAANECATRYPGKGWMHFAAPGDTRPKSSFGVNRYRTWENRGTRAFDGSWKAAIGDGTHRAADFQQIVTWNDYAEHAHIAPTENNGFNLVDINTYYVEKYKTGNYPTIIRDALYLSHRLHHSTATIDPGSKQIRKWIIAGGTAVYDEIEVRAFLTATATVQIMLDGVEIHSETVSAGDTFVNCPLPATTGTISARAIRGGVTVRGTAVTSRFPLQVTPLAVDDMHYRSASSLRQGTY